MCAHGKEVCVSCGAATVHRANARGARRTRRGHIEHEGGTLQAKEAQRTRRRYIAPRRRHIAREGGTSHAQGLGHRKTDKRTCESLYGTPRAHNTRTQHTHQTPRSRTPRTPHARSTSPLVAYWMGFAWMRLWRKAGRGGGLDKGAGQQGGGGASWAGFNSR
eukprot:CAMPEP_0181308142 /NCGR_PEP_ID=MMETSP1101-20121128/11291_1 /TAXON_ID=46948 /ORGANISM="Rhodomonas abbreviata, Strain Caron Lab Isolate" /LENGTH=161 /DNA_ID=CAMNT_0023414477 /DNA_START=152 /DNA_END=634 /DNA_ORIENTATION=-